ncbi:hypothetical protein H0H92_012921 [Tricholoma furcatifolium]|nr:hypothetical protein H0H92_012921 [Tricholoma furcatifolium]
MGIGTAVAIGRLPEFAQFQKFQVVVIIWLVSASFADILITYSLVSYLRKHRSSFSQTDTRVDRISRRFITAVWAFVDMMVYLLDPTGLHLLFNFPLSKLYTNSLMSSLNARSFWKYNNTTDDAIINSHKATIQLSNLRSDGDVTIKTQVFVQVQSHRVIDPPDEKFNLGDCSDDQDSASRTAISPV